MKIGFTGHRDKIANEESILRIEEQYPGATWIHGGADGFDSQVNEIALKLGKVEGETLIVIRPDYRNFKASVAPIIRNKTIVDMSELMYACWDGRKKGGTFQAKNYAIDKGVPVKYLTPKE